MPRRCVVPGTDMVAIVPEHLARRAESERGPVGRLAPDGALFYEIWGTDASPAPDVLGGLLHDPMEA